MSGIAHGHGQMRAQSISIQLSTRERCNARCKYCISRTTPGYQAAEKVKECDIKQLEKGLNYARHLGATHAVLTGRADPTQERLPYLEEIIKTSQKYVPLVDMHTNGFKFGKGLQDIDPLVEAGLTMITFSIASFDQPVNQQLMGIDTNPEKVIKMALDHDLLVRCSLVVNKQGTADFDGIIDYIIKAGELGAHMVVVREVWVPEVYGEYNKEVFDWNKDNKVEIQSLQQEFIEAAEDKGNKYGLKMRDPLPWGTPVFVVGDQFTDRDHGVNVTFALCEEGTKGSVIKSIVHKPNGHGYRNWDHNGDILY